MKYGLHRRQVSQLEEGEVGTLHPIYQVTCQPWIIFMAKLGKCHFRSCVFYKIYFSMIRKTSYSKEQRSSYTFFCEMAVDEQVALPFSSVQLTLLRSSFYLPSWQRLSIWLTHWPVIQQ